MNSSAPGIPGMPHLKFPARSVCGRGAAAMRSRFGTACGASNWCSRPEEWGAAASDRLPRLGVRRVGQAYRREEHAVALNRGSPAGRCRVRRGRTTGEPLLLAECKGARRADYRADAGAGHALQFGARARWIVLTNGLAPLLLQNTATGAIAQLPVVSRSVRGFSYRFLEIGVYVVLERPL